MPSVVALLICFGTSAAHAALVAPVLQGDGRINPPADAPPLVEDVAIRARITIDVDGAVARVELLDGATGPLAEAVLVGACRFTFAPALDDGVPVLATVVLTQVFSATPPPTLAEAPPKSVLRGVVVERGTRRPVPFATVQADTSDGVVDTLTDALGNFSLAVPPGTFEVRVAASGYKAFLVHESLDAQQMLAARYIVERHEYEPYETTVVGKRDTTDVSRTTLSGREIYTVAGTFGDPFRVISSMPGVSNVFSLVGYPIVRGTSPGSSGMLLESVPLPELFHLLAGPSVVHPEFIDHVDFYPGTFPVRYGGYVGGIVDGVTRRARADEHRIDIDVDLLQAGAFVREPLLWGTTGTVAARYGYPGLLLDATGAAIRLEYWDYQARLDGTLGPGNFKVFAYGSGDNLTTTSGSLSSLAYATTFHRLNLGYQHTMGPVSGDYSVYVGVDKTAAGGVITGLQALSAAPYFRWKTRLSDHIRLNWGLDGSFSAYGGFITLNNTALQSHLYDTGGFVELPVALTDALELTPAFRADVYQNPRVTVPVYDPRLSLRLRVNRRGAGDTVLKGGFGRFHQPPRLIVPVPGLQALALSSGVEGAWQSMIGAEVPIVTGVDVDVQFYFNYTNPIIFDLASNTDPHALTTSEQAPNNSTLFGSVLTPQIGRAYGMEIILRHRDMGQLFGWLSYTLSRTERLHDGSWVPWDYDRTHMLQAVAGMTLPRNWQFGMRLGVETGRPISTPTSYNTERSPGYARLDVRIDKRAVWESWLLDFYIDVINVTMSPEFIDQASISPRYILPTIGLRAVL